MAFQLCSSKIIVAALAAATVLGAASVGNAAIISNTVAVTSPSITPAFAKFNSTLGILTGATITVTLNLHPTEIELNVAAAPGTPFSIILTGLTFSDTDPNSHTTTQMYDFTGDPTYTAIGVAGTAGTKQTFTKPDVVFTSSTVVATASLPTYIGATGTITPVFTDSAKTAITAVGPGQGLSASVPFDGTATITYTYTPTPEPASLSLLALGGAALLTRRRAR